MRAIDILKSVEIIAAEDTRHTARLLSHYNIAGRMVSCHEHNEAERTSLLIDKLKAGKSVALVSDAGTPTVSDPGYRLVSAALESDIRVVPIPGVSAAIAALSASGLPSDTFCFVGFTPKKKSKRTEMLHRLSAYDETLIFYESPKRIIAFLHEIEAIMGDRYIVVARELTKRHEELLRGRISDLIAELDQRAAVKGEFTLLVSGATPETPDISSSLQSEIETALKNGDIKPSALAHSLSKRYSIPKNKIYKEILEIKSHIDE